MFVSLLIVIMITEVVTGIPTTLQDISVEQSKNDYIHISREAWKARSPRERTPLKTPVSFVVIHHSFIPPVCENKTECAYAMRTMQSMHMDDRKLVDIGYNFAVGGDGNVYEGRGWKRLGAHSLYFDTDSIGICLIGNYDDSLPSQKMLESTKQLVQEGVRQGFLKEDYKIVGHRQVRPTY